MAVALMGKSAGEVAVVETPRGEKRWRVERIGA